jgi:hypothetical protein
MSSLAADLEHLWSSAKVPPDLVTWWSSAVAASPRTTPNELLVALRLDQQRRWQTDQPWKVEDYLQRLRLPTGTDWRQELLSGEIDARRNSPTPLTPEELSSRFPDLSDTFKQQLVANKPATGVYNPAVDDATELYDPDELSTRSVPLEPVDAQGRYLIPLHDDPLGEGAFATVFRAFDTVLRRRVAVKVLKESTFAELEEAEEFIREARLAAALSHPFILPVFDVGLTAGSNNFSAGRVYVVTQLFTGGTLKEHLAELRRQNQLMDVRSAARLIKSLAEALDYAWNSGNRIIHRDVKPGNILLEKESHRPCLADFGLSIWDQDGFHKDKHGAGHADLQQSRTAGRRNSSAHRPQ